MTAVITDEKIPNNVNLAGDRRLQRALEEWQPHFLSWWQDMGPVGFQTKDIYLRTAVSVESDGWAHFDYVKMPDYRWGIFLEPKQEGRTHGFGDFHGQPVWDEVPGEFRNLLRRLIVTQGDTEPASVEQQRHLGATAPSLYDLRNLFQVNVEEGRHLWAMVYLLHTYFGRDGREEAEELLRRRSGDSDKPRILGAFNEPTPHWLSFFMFTFFTDRDGKYQLAALAESGFDPLARTCRFMLTEEAHHMFVGETGVQRVAKRACELMKQDPNGDVRAKGGIDLPTLQKYLNLHFTLSLDLFGGEVSSNAADAFAAGLKGRYKEDRYAEHKLIGSHYTMDVLEEGRAVTKDIAMRNALNEVLRNEYIKDCQRGVDRWNKTIRDEGIDFELKLPSNRFHRQIGMWSTVCATPSGELIDRATWDAKKGDWLPDESDERYIKSLMKPASNPGQMASWIAAPAKGINGLPDDFVYVRD
ncbi:MAG: benzoyl-CoA 2,3-epoxidase subunit BoxB [Kofleriaceae bacterium]|jgi:benzoyl-CoA 2,3-dioxygenase component B|nr:benzoyl-CoA 2,3-epoxidase subunit BoxB [Kofleriaceae bacterium]MBP9169210.1 benzoyl-CoA 2,3-epoxidase subunit BoxB [Kofleriaceae bacterium]MBP9859115.1 benzoyl-CoA 2,3-epoxidase subunit BoxB [Kofleriaceae bacterium]